MVNEATSAAAESADQGPRGRTVTVLSLGSRLSIVVGLLLLVLAGYFFYVPIQFDTQAGPFKCGSAARPPTDDFGKNTCAYRPMIMRYRALSVGLAAVIVIVGGVASFGAIRRREDERVTPMS